MTTPLDETVYLDGRRIHIWIRGEGRPLLLLNGIGASLETWGPLEWQLTGLRTIAFDAPGSGRSQSPRVPLPVSGHARLALRLVEILGYDEVSVLGFSFGGMVAQELARLGRDRVDRLVLASTSCGWGGVPGPASLIALAAPETYFSASLTELVGPELGRNVEEATRPAPPSARAPVWNRRRRVGPAYQFWAAATWSSAPWLHQVRQPTLVVTGETDPIVPVGNGRILAALLPDARLHVVPAGGHLCLLERAAELAPLLRGFLRAG